MDGGSLSSFRFVCMPVGLMKGIMPGLPRPPRAESELLPESWMRAPQNPELGGPWGTSGEPNRSARPAPRCGPGPAASHDAPGGGRVVPATASALPATKKEDPAGKGQILSWKCRSNAPTASAVGPTNTYHTQKSGRAKARPLSCVW